jgi:glucose 1-dehydrogenase
MLKGIESKNVLVTGAAQGIGFAVARRFTEEGASVFIVDRVETAQMATALENIRSVAKNRKALIAGHRADISNEAAVDEAFQAAVAPLGQIDILVNNAGINRGYPSDQFPVEEFDQVLNVNLRAVFIFSQLTIRHFLERKIPGVIVNNSSNHESQPKPGFIAFGEQRGAGKPHKNISSRVCR